MTDEITVKLTRPQLDALLAAAAYCTAGAPEDWGQPNNATGMRMQDTLDRARTRLNAARTPRGA